MLSSYSNINKQKLAVNKKPLIISLGGLTGPHKLLPFLRFSRLYPRILVPPVSAGGDQERVIQSLKELTTLGADGGPGYAVYRKEWD